MYITHGYKPCECDYIERHYGTVPDKVKEFLELNPKYKLEKKMANNSHIPRTFELLRALGWEPAMTERWQQFGGKFGIRQDLYGFIDCVAIPNKKGAGLLALQVCSVSTVSDHIAKIKANPNTLRFCGSCDHIRVELWAWSKRKQKRGGIAVRWWLKRYKILVGKNKVVVYCVDEIGPGHKWAKKLRTYKKKKAGA